MTTPRKLTSAQAVEIREIYEHTRNLARNDPEYEETVFDTETRLGERFSVSRSLIRQVVIGTAYKHAGGPIDESRRAASREARAEAPPTATLVVVTRPGAEPREFVYPPGTEVMIVATTDDPEMYSASGLPLTRSRAAGTPSPTPAPATKPKRKRNLTAGMSSREFARHTREQERLAYERGDAEVDSAAPSRGNL